MSWGQSQTKVSQAVGRQGAGVYRLTIGHVTAAFWGVCFCVQTPGKNTKRQSHEVKDEHIKSDESDGKEHAVLQIRHSYYRPIRTADCSRRLTMGGGLVSPANPGVPGPVVFWPWWSVSFQQGKELAAVLVQIVTDSLRTFGARLGA